MAVILREEIIREGFASSETAKEKGWYRKHFYCEKCGTLIREECWDTSYQFGTSTILKSNVTPNFCPICGTPTDSDHAAPGRDIRWIPCSERLPKEDINPITQDWYVYPVSVRFDNDKEDIRYYKFGKGHWWHGGTIMDSFVRAWMELPEVYREEKKCGE